MARCFIVMVSWIVSALLATALTVIIFDYLHEQRKSAAPSWNPDANTTLTDRLLSRGKRYHDDPDDPDHHFQQNMWWYANYTAHAQNASNCYVCSHMPISSTNHGGRARDLPFSLAACLLGLSTHPGYGRNLTPNYLIPLKVTQRGQGIIQGLDCSMIADLLPWSQLTEPLVISDVIHTHNHLLCFAGNGSVPVGTLTKTSCKITWVYCRYVSEIKYIDCALNYQCKNKAIQFTEASKRINDDAQWCSKIRNTTCQCSGTVPTHLETSVLSDYYFLCGDNDYANLPPCWGGVCSLVSVSHPIAVIPASQVSRHPVIRTHRVKRDELADRGVPYDQRIWGKGTLVAYSLFPSLWVADSAREITYNRYSLLRFIDISLEINNATAEEISALRAVALQNRMVLDMSLAAQGGVCTIIGEACCTFIPDHTGEGGKITKALTELFNLRDDVQSTIQSYNWDWWSWMTSGSWVSVLVKFLTPVIIVLKLLCCLFSLWFAGALPVCVCGPYGSLHSPGTEGTGLGGKGTT